MEVISSNNSRRSSNSSCTCYQNRNPLIHILYTKSNFLFKIKCQWFSSTHRGRNIFQATFLSNSRGRCVSCSNIYKLRWQLAIPYLVKVTEATANPFYCTSVQFGPSHWKPSTQPAEFERYSRRAWKLVRLFAMETKKKKSKLEWVYVHLCDAARHLCPFWKRIRRAGAKEYKVI